MKNGAAALRYKIVKRQFLLLYRKLPLYSPVYFSFMKEVNVSSESGLEK